MDLPTRTPYLADVTDDAWAFVSPYRVLMDETAPPRTHDLREVFNGVRWSVRTVSRGACCRTPSRPGWRSINNRSAGCAGVFATMVHDLRVLIRVASGRPLPPAAIFDARTVQSTAESGGRAGYDGHNRRKGSQTHLAVDTLGRLLAVQLGIVEQTVKIGCKLCAEAIAVA